MSYDEPPPTADPFGSATQPLTGGPQKVDPRPGNWPFWCARPCKLIHHDIAAEIPSPRSRSVIRKLYFAWYLGWVAVIMNAASQGSRIGTTSERVAVDFVISIAYIPGYVILSLVIYWIAYTAARTESGLFTTLYYILTLVEALIQAFFILGFHFSAMGGIIQMVSMFHMRVASGLISLISTVLWSFLLVWNLVMAIMFWRRHVVPSVASPEEAPIRGPPTIIDGGEGYQPPSASVYGTTAADNGGNPFGAPAGGEGSGNPFE